MNSEISIYRAEIFRIELLRPNARPTSTSDLVTSNQQAVRFMQNENIGAPQLKFNVDPDILDFPMIYKNRSHLCALISLPTRKMENTKPPRLYETW